MPEPIWCGMKRKGEGEEELTLTPHHTPSQSFDFIVWEKAYLDSIPAPGASKEAPSFKPNFTGGPPSSKTSSSSLTPPHFVPPSRPPPLQYATCMCVDGCFLDPTTLCVHRPPPFHYNLKLSLDKERLVPLLHSPSSSRDDATLLACRTDADLPPSFFDSKPRISDGGFTSLEEAVRNYANRHPQAIGNPSPSRRSMEHRPRSNTSTNHNSLQINVDHEVLLRRSYSQPGAGAGISKGLFDMGFNKPTASKRDLAGSAVFGHARIYQDECYATPARNHTKLSCFPTSPGRRKHGQSTLDDGKSTQSAGISENPRLDRCRHRQQEKLRSPAYNPTLDIHLQQQNKLLSSATWADVMHMRAGGHPPGGIMQDTAPACYYRNSSSDMSSDYHDAAVALNMSKLKLWGLHHRFKALCKKLCSICSF